MKKLFVLIVTGFLIFLALPQEMQAQCPANADSNPCYALPSGGCVCFPSGKYKLWVSAPILLKAKTAMTSQFPHYSFADLLKAYYVTDELGIEYLGGTWENGQTFRVVMGGGNVIVVIGDGEL